MESRSSSRAESVAYVNIEKCGLYQDGFREWSCNTRRDKTWSKFKAHFARAFKETQISSITSKTEDYAAHVHTAQAKAALFNEM